jgi:hypothetical protein
MIFSYIFLDFLKINIRFTNFQKVVVYGVRIQTSHTNNIWYREPFEAEFGAEDQWLGRLSQRLVGRKETTLPIAYEDPDAICQGCLRIHAPFEAVPGPTFVAFVFFM